MARTLRASPTLLISVSTYNRGESAGWGGGRITITPLAVRVIKKGPTGRGLSVTVTKLLKIKPNLTSKNVLCLTLIVKLILFIFYATCQIHLQKSRKMYRRSGK